MDWLIYLSAVLGIPAAVATLTQASPSGIRASARVFTSVLLITVLGVLSYRVWRENDALSDARATAEQVSARYSPSRLDFNGDGELMYIVGTALSVLSQLGDCHEGLVNLLLDEVAALPDYEPYGVDGQRDAYYRSRGALESTAGTALGFLDSVAEGRLRPCS